MQNGRNYILLLALLLGLTAEGGAMKKKASSRKGGGSGVARVAVPGPCLSNLTIPEIVERVTASERFHDLAVAGLSPDINPHRGLAAIRALRPSGQRYVRILLARTAKRRDVFAYGPYFIGSFVHTALQAIDYHLKDDQVTFWWEGELELSNGFAVRLGGTDNVPQTPALMNAVFSRDEFPFSSRNLTYVALERSAPHLHPTLNELGRSNGGGALAALGTLRWEINQSLEDIQRGYDRIEQEQVTEGQQLVTQGFSYLARNELPKLIKTVRMIESDGYPFQVEGNAASDLLLDLQQRSSAHGEMTRQDLTLVRQVLGEVHALTLLHGNKLDENGTEVQQDMDQYEMQAPLVRFFLLPGGA